MFTVEGELTIGDSVTLSGKTANCGGGEVSGPFDEDLPDPTTKTVTKWAKKDVTYVFQPSDVGKQVLFATNDLTANASNAEPGTEDGIAYIDQGDGNTLHLKEIDDVLLSTESGDLYLAPADSDGYVATGDSGTYADASNSWALKVASVEEPESGRFTVLLQSQKEGVTGYLGRTANTPGSPIGITANGDPFETNDSDFDNGVFHKFWIGGGDNVQRKLITINENAGNEESDKKFAIYANGRSGIDRFTSRTYFYIEDGTTEVDVWTIDGKEYYREDKATEAYKVNPAQYWLVSGDSTHYATRQEAEAAANSGGCTVDNTCSKVTGEQFHGDRGSEKGYFVQVNAGGTFNLEGNAELRDLITDDTVTYAAPIVANGGTVNLNGGKITHNSVGYSAHNEHYNKLANEIGDTGSNKEKGKIAEYANTETAGALILTNGSTGEINGTDISGNRGDTGAVVVQGKPDRDPNTLDGSASNTDVENGDATKSTLKINSGHLDGNVGIHHAGALYIFNGAAVDMNGGTINENVSWIKGGAVWVSEEAYASFVWAPPEGTPSNLPVGSAAFVMNGGEISGNMSVERAGAIEVMSNHVALMAGSITNNTSRVLGGAIYIEGDGKDRMYQLFIQKGCITDNYAVRDEYYADSAKLYRTLNTDTDCDFKNDLNGETASDISDRGYGFNHYYGHGGGIWLCPFGGNVTFAVPSSEVVVAGNHADGSSPRDYFGDPDGKDILVRPLAAGKTNGVNFLKLGPENVFVNEQNGAIINDNNASGVHVDGRLALTNTASETCSSDGVTISGNVASDGGGIASNGTIIFGEEAEIAQAFTKIHLEKVWSDQFTEEEKAAKTVTLRLQANVDGELVDTGYEVTLNGEADPEDSDDVDNNAGVEVTKSKDGNWAADMGMPLSISTENGPISLVTFDVNGDTEEDEEGNLINTSDDLDPSKTDDLVQIYKMAELGTLTAENAKLADWKLVVTEEVNGYKVEHIVDLGQGKVTKLNALEQKNNTFKDLADNVVGTVTIDPIEIEFESTIGNDKQPEAEKYVNQDVHADIVEFDKEFTYDVMAYVPMDATEFTITDPLVEALEFADAEGNATTDPLAAIQSITVKNQNDHSTSVKAAADSTLDKNKASTEIPSNTLTVTVDDPDEVAKAQGKWVQLTFNARIKDEYRNLDALKEAGWAQEADNKQGDPIPDPELSDQAKRVLALEQALGTPVDLYNEDAGHAYAKVGEYYYQLSFNSDNEWYRLGVEGGLSTYTPVTKEGDTISGYDVEAEYQFNGTYASQSIANRGTEPTHPETVEYGPNWPVDSDATHEGVKNQATYDVKFGNDSESSHKTNTVTVEPDTEELNVEKTWGNDGSWPAEVAKVVFGIFQVKDGAETPVYVDAAGKVVAADAAGATELTVELNSGKTTDTVKDLPKLKGTEYVAREVKVGDTDVAYANDAKTAGIAKISDVLEYIVNIVKEAGASDEEADTFIATNSKPEVEKYVNDKVHAELDTFDTAFEYDIMGYVPAGATKVVLSDSLKPQLKLLSTKADIEASAVAKAENNHTVGGSVAAGGDPVAAVATVNGNDVEVTIENDGSLDGKWVQITLKAEIDKDAYEDIANQLASDDPDAAAEAINWAKVEKNDPVKGGDATHSGLLNKASYKVFVGEEGSADYETNTVTIKPKTTTVSATKEWQNADGTAADWPADVASVTVNVYGAEPAEGEEAEPVDTLTITKDAETGKATVETSKALPVLDGVEYTVEEVAIPGYSQVGEATGTGTEADPYVFTNKSNGEQKIEKYINKDVHASLVEFDKAFTYDILAYVTNDAESIEITDTLVNALEFAKAPEEGQAGVATTEASEAVAAIVAKAKNDHTANSTVAGADADNPGTDLGEAAVATISEDGKTLTVAVDDATAYRGQWIQVTFYAKYTQATINAARVGDSKTVKNNGAVISEITDHKGTANTASYKIKVDNEWTDKVDSNTVTHDAETITVEAEKVWKNADGTTAEWPEGVESVKVKVMNDLTKKQVATITLTKDTPKAASKKLPKLTGVTYSIKENTVPGYISKVDGNVVTNTEGEGPEVEKYVNNDVTYDFENFDQVFEYEIMGYVTNDATKAEFTDTLNSVLEFAGENGDIKVFAMGTENDHKATVAGAGTEVDASTYTASAADGKLSVAFDEAGITPLRGQWVKVTFKAQISEDGRDAVAAKIAEKAKARTKVAADADAWANIDDNGTVLIETPHDGVPNTAGLTMSTANNGDFDLSTNTVTVEPQTITLKATKAWKSATDAAIEWPEGARVTFQLVKVEGDTETVIESKNLAKAGAVTFTAQPKLEGVTYKVVESRVAGVDADQVGQAVVADDVWTFTNKLKPEEPAIEKYVNKNVHSEISLDEVFTYDVLAYVTKDANKVEIFDTLNADLQFAGTAADVKVADLGETVDHTPNGSVAAEGTALGDAAAAAIAGQKLTVTIADATAFRGHWVKVTFDAKIADGKQIEDLQYTKVEKNEPVLTDEAHEGVPNTASYKIEAENDGSYELDSNTVTVKPNKPEIEKYIDQAVHKDIKLGDTFTYSLIAWVTNDADTVTITDELMKDLAFANGNDTAVAVEALGAEDNHKVVNNVKGEAIDGNADATVAAAGTPVQGAQVAIDGQKLTVSIADATAVRGQWVRVTFDAKVNATKVADVAGDYEKISATAAEDRDAPNVGNAPVISDEDHEGLPNSASYTIGVKQTVVDDNGNETEEVTEKYSDESNTVTVKPTEPKHEIIFSKVELGTDTPEVEGAKIKVTGPNGFVEEWTSTTEPHKMQLEQGDYTFEEVNAPEGFLAITTEVEFTVNADGTVTVKTASEQIGNGGKVTIPEDQLNHLILEDAPKLEPAIEKYVNKDVHQNLVEFDKAFTYDVMALVTYDATKVEIYDELVENLEFADASGKATTDAAQAVVAVVAKADNDHTANGSVAAEGTNVQGAKCVIDGQKLTVTIDDASAVRGQWVQVTFNARIKDTVRSMDALQQQTITANDPVITDIDSHTGEVNTASYAEFDNAGGALEYFKGEDGSVKPLESNTVTVVPEGVNVTVNKTWLNAENWEQPSPAQWPAGATVTAQIMAGEELIETVTLDAEHPSVTVAGLPKLQGVTYSVVEPEVAGVFALADDPVITTAEDGSLTMDLTNRLTPRKSERFVDFIKVDPAGQALAGATLAIEGTTYFGDAYSAEWETTGEAYRVDNLPAGEYKLIEKAAPEGYAIADPIEFIIDESGVLLIGGQPVAEGVVTMVDQLKPEVPGDEQSTTPAKGDDKPGPTPKNVAPSQGTNPVATRPLSKTGAGAGLPLVFMLTLIGTGAGVLVARRREMN